MSEEYDRLRAIARDVIMHHPDGSITVVATDEEFAEFKRELARVIREGADDDDR